MNTYSKHVPSTPREKKIGRKQVANSAGGFVFEVNDWTRLDRFLVLGTEGGTFYAGERELTRANAAVVERLLKVNGPQMVERIAHISEEGRAPKNDPAVFALAMCLKLGDTATRQAAAVAVPRVCRTGTHMFHLAEAVKAFGGWGRNTQAAFENWYKALDAQKLALQVVKYQQRDGWSHRDILRKIHLQPSVENAAILNYAVKGWPGVGEVPHPDRALQVIWAFEKAKTAKGRELVRLIEEFRLPHECVPNEQKNDPNVWAAMLPSMGVTALIRNLGKLTNVGLLSPMSESTKIVTAKLNDVELLRKGRVHPIQVLLATKTYAQGHGEKGKLSWVPNQQVVNALDSAFYSSFKAVEPTNKRTMLALDISGSMGQNNIAGMTGITASVGSCAMALITAATEQQHMFVGFTSRTGRPTAERGGLSILNINPRQRLDDVVRYTQGLPMSGTDCALPMIFATEAKLPIDTFVIYTDNETWAGNVQPVDALKNYRQKLGIPAKVVVVGMTATGFSIADPTDAGMLDVTGFDSAAPQVIADFARE
jgi:60 kDa SS-A/Ro ribonucleoprotein